MAQTLCCWVALEGERAAKQRDGGRAGVRAAVPQEHAGLIPGAPDRLSSFLPVGVPRRQGDGGASF